LSQADTIAGLGTRADYVAVVPNVSPSQARLSAEETAVFACVGRAAQIQEVISRSGFSEPKTIAVLLSLRAKGVIAPAKVAKSASVDAAMSEAVDLDEARKKEILDLERVLDSANHYDVLGLRPGASAEQVKAAFYEASRRYHPDRYFGKNLGSFRARIDHIFKRLSEAQTVLTDDAKRSAYLKAHPELAVDSAPRPKTPEEERRDAERRARFAKHPYLAKASRVSELVQRAKAHIEKKEFGHAYSALSLAAQADPKNAEIKALLEDAKANNEIDRAKNALKKGSQLELEGNLEQALAEYRMGASHSAEAAAKATRLILKLNHEAREAKLVAERAVELDSKNVDYRLLLASVLLACDLKALARRQFDEVLKLDPSNAEAKKHLKKWWPF
jgi:curved DNA-binding protein CbpA